METGTIITLSFNNDKEKNELDELLMIIKRIKRGIQDKKGLKIITSTEVSKTNKVYHNIYINRKLEVDIREEWKHGKSVVQNVETTDLNHKIMEYILL